jgi:4-hydroxy-tetrahydrodipicolinate synthase
MFKGTITSMITPFTETGEVDWKAFRDLMEWQVEAKVDAIVCCGTTGEAPTLSEEEQFQIFKIALEVSKKRVPIIAGTGTYNTKKTAEATVRAKELGVDGCLVVVPYYNRPTPEGCMAHFREVSKVGLPTIIYHHPGRTGVRLSAHVLSEIAKFPSMVGIKETSGGLDLMREIQALSRIPILSGDDTLAYAMMEEGAVGIISIVANMIPELWTEMTKSFFSGDRSRAKEIDEQCKPLYQSLVIENNPQGVKYGLSLLSKCRADLRLPLVQPRETTKLEIFRAWTKLKSHVEVKATL